MTKKKKENKVNLLTYDPVETPEEIIKEDKNLERKKAFLDTYQRIARIIPEYFISQKKKKKGSANSGGTAFSQNIVVTPDKVTVQTQEIKEQEKQEEREEKERE